MTLLFRILSVLYFFFYNKVFKEKRLLKNLNTAPNGLQYKMYSERIIFIPLKNTFYLKILRENFWHRFCKKIGLGVEFQTQDADFDKNYYIEADQKFVQTFIQSNAEVKKLITKILVKGVSSLQFTGRGGLKIKIGKVVPSSLFEEILELKKLIESLTDSYREKDSYLQSAYFLELVVLALGAYGISSTITLQFDRGQTHLDPFGLFGPGLIFGFLIILLWILLCSLFLKRSSRAPVLLLESLGYLILTLFGAGPQLMFDLNQLLDSTDAIEVLAKVNRVEERVIRKRKGSNTIYLIHLQIPHNKFNIPERLEVNSMDLGQFNEGQGVSISIKQGFFDSPYIAGFSPATFTEEKPLTISSAELEALVNYEPNTIKDWESIPGLTWQEERYSSGKLRQREPMVEGRQHGIGSYWHENGVKYADIPWTMGKKNGKFTLYREDGSMDQSLCYLEGALHGVSTWYDKEGQVISKGVYQGGKLVKDLLK